MPAEPRRWLTTSLPMMGFFLVTVALSQSDLYFLEMLGDEHEVGLYASSPARSLARSTSAPASSSSRSVSRRASGVQAARLSGSRGGRRAPP